MGHLPTPPSDRFLLSSPSHLSLPQITTNPEYPRPLHPPPPTSELQSFIASQHIHLQWPVQHLTFTTHTTMLPFSLKNGTLKAVSDGSWKAPHSAAAFILGDIRHPHTILARGANTMPPAFPAPFRGSSYRSEISGILGVLRFIQFIDQLYRIPHGGTTIACDSKGALSQVFGAQPLSHKQPDFDLLSLARETLLDLTHVKFTVQQPRPRPPGGRYLVPAPRPLGAMQRPSRPHCQSPCQIPGTTPHCTIPSHLYKSLAIVVELSLGMECSLGQPTSPPLLQIRGTKLLGENPTTLPANHSGVTTAF